MYVVPYMPCPALFGRVLWNSHSHTAYHTLSPAHSAQYNTQAACRQQHSLFIFIYAFVFVKVK